MNKTIKTFLIFILLNIVAFNVTAQVVDSTLVRPKITLLNGTYILEWDSDADKKVGLGIQTPLDEYRVDNDTAKSLYDKFCNRYNISKMQQFTVKQAKAIYDSNIWENWTDIEIAQVQLFQNKRCIPDEEFYKSLSNVLETDVDLIKGMDIVILRHIYLDLYIEPTYNDILLYIPKELLIK